MMNHVPRALVVDDEPDIRELIILTLQRMQIDCTGAKDLAEAKQWLTKKEFALCLTDMRLQDGSGIELVEYMQREFPEIPVAVITAYGNMEVAVTALKAGAFDFVAKPVNLQILRNLVDTALKLSVVEKRESGPFRKELLGESPAAEWLRSMIHKLARSQAPVLIAGPSGSGKELVARLIHQLGPRGDAPFVPVNCGAIPSELVESEFFGYKKGSFTGALMDKGGLFQAAQHGTLFLDEIADLPLHMQVKLLRVIQEKAVRPIGSQEEFPIDVRILSASHKNLPTLVSEGKFRQDLFYRINVIQLAVPSLQERQEDIPILAETFLQRLSRETGLPKTKLSAEARAKLMKYSFPGNVRELENILERAVALCENAMIKVQDLHLDERAPEVLETVYPTDLPLTSYLDTIERDAIMAALVKNRWNKTRTAEQLGLSLRALRYRLKRLGLEK